MDEEEEEKKMSTMNLIIVDMLLSERIFSVLYHFLVQNRKISWVPSYFNFILKDIASNQIQNEKA